MLPRGIEQDNNLVQQMLQDQIRRRYWLDILSQQNQEKAMDAFLLTIVAFSGVPFVFSPRNISRSLTPSSR